MSSDFSLEGCPINTQPPETPRLNPAIKSGSSRFSKSGGQIPDLFPALGAKPHGSWLAFIEHLSPGVVSGPFRR